MYKLGIIVFFLFLIVACNDELKYLDENLAIEKRIDDLLSRMTLKEKIEQLGGTGFDTKENGKLNIPILGMTDGPVGVRWGEATALPAAVALASTWDRELIYEVGEMLGEETLSKDRNILLGPCVNIHRFPVGGRNFESFGEDPYLAGQIAVPYIKGVQSKNVIACVKHFACNNQEWQRDSVNAVVDERALHEIYLPAFKAAVQEADVWSVMTSYSRVNDYWTSENSYLLNDVLKDKWGFEGFVVSDWGASHSTIGSVNAGLDLEMPYPMYMNDSLIIPKINGNLISEKTIDDKVRRLMRVRMKAKMFDEELNISKNIHKSEKHKEIAYKAALNGMVLLKNENNLLPIDQKKIKKIAVIGPNAAFARIGGGGSSKVQPEYAISPLEALKNKIDESIEINYSPGAIIKNDVQIIEANYFSSELNTTGLKAEYFNNTNLSGEALFIRNDSEVNFLWYYDAPRWDLHGANDDNYFSVRWQGTLSPPKTGTYKFQIIHNDGARLKINGKTIIDNWKNNRRSKLANAEIKLKKTKKYEIVLEYYNNGSVSEIKLGWEIPNQNLLADAVNNAKNSDMAIVCVGLSNRFEGEGRDRDFLVLENQDRLIKEIIKVNPKTIVVMITGTPPIMEAWADFTPAILQAWFGGQEGGNAIADILLGNSNPSGKLPCSFYRKKSDSPGFEDYRDPSLQSIYSEGIYVGYRYLDKFNISPRFAFGHGLSYTSFSFSNPTIKKLEKDEFHLEFTVTNSGTIKGSEVTQVYVSPIDSPIDRAKKELKAFEKVSLDPNESKLIEIELSKEDFSYYNIENSKWQISSGEYQIMIGSSSVDIRLNQTINVEGI